MDKTNAQRQARHREKAKDRIRELEARVNELEHELSHLRSMGSVHGDPWPETPWEEEIIEP